MFFPKQLTSPNSLVPPNSLLWGSFLVKKRLAAICSNCQSKHLTRWPAANPSANKYSRALMSQQPSALPHAHGTANPPEKCIKICPLDSKVWTFIRASTASNNKCPWKCAMRTQQPTTKKIWICSIWPIGLWVAKNTLKMETRLLCERARTGQGVWHLDAVRLLVQNLRARVFAPNFLPPAYKVLVGLFVQGTTSARNPLCKISVSKSLRQDRLGTLVPGSCTNFCARGREPFVRDLGNPCVTISATGSCWSTCIRIRQDFLCQICVSRSLNQDPFEPLVQDLCRWISASGSFWRTRISISCWFSVSKFVHGDVLELFVRTCVAGSFWSTCIRIRQDFLCQICVSRSLNQDLFAPLVQDLCRWISASGSFWKTRISILCRFSVSRFVHGDLLELFVRTCVAGSFWSTCIRIRQDFLCQIWVSRSLNQDLFAPLVQDLCRWISASGSFWKTRISILCRFSVSRFVHGDLLELFVRTCVAGSFWSTCIRIRQDFLCQTCVLRSLNPDHFEALIHGDHHTWCCESVAQANQKMQLHPHSAPLDAHNPSRRARRAIFSKYCAWSYEMLRLPRGLVPKLKFPTCNLSWDWNPSTSKQNVNGADSPRCSCDMQSSKWFRVCQRFRPATNDTTNPKRTRPYTYRTNPLVRTHGLRIIFRETTIMQLRQGIQQDRLRHSLIAKTCSRNHGAFN